MKREWGDWEGRRFVLGDENGDGEGVGRNVRSVEYSGSGDEVIVV